MDGEEIELKEEEIPETMHIDIPEEETIVDPLLEDDDDEQKDTEDSGMFGEDKAFEEQILDPYGDKDHY